MTFKITKYVHACLLVETPGQVALFDPGSLSTQSIKLDGITQLDDIFITHAHSDHYDVEFIKKLVAKFPDVRITTTDELVKELDKAGLAAGSQAPEGVEFFNSPHENVKPLYPQPQEIGIHYLNSLTDPGDSHSFTETKAILALPVTAPWGSNIKALNLALELKPKHVLPIHDWHWRDQARQQAYDMLQKQFSQHDITFHKLENGKPVEIEI
jgi:L-ascorbate metabolism protein UlaG (beta-lactamase superfamily)